LGIPERPEMFFVFFISIRRSTLVQLRARDDAANITGVRRLIASEHSEGCSAYSWCW
jgi:hypothetical protein